jgi:broad specificity phosphatase PhoE
VNAAELNGRKGVDDDGDGSVDDLYGYNAITGGGDLTDNVGHGTHVAGTIGAAGNNGVGVAGVNWNVRIMACKFLDATGGGSTAEAIACLHYVADMKRRGVNIVATNNSWGGPAYSRALQDAIDAQRDILFITAAGNDGTNSDLTPTYPANFDLPNVVAVAASTSADALATERVAAVYASPLGRTRATAEIIARPQGLAVIADPSLREMAFGDWEGLTRTEVEARWPDLFDLWRRSPERAVPAGGEGLLEVAGRAGKALQQIRDNHPDGTVVLVSHAIVLRLIVLDALGLGPERLWSLDASPAGLTEIEYLPGWATVHRMNTLAHLRGLPA